MDKLVDWGYWGMFLSAFLAGSIIPANSEIVLSALLALEIGRASCRERVPSPV